MTTTLLTPVELSTTAVKVAPRRYRKQILPLKTITYKGRKITFDKPMLTKVMDAYNEQAVHQVPWQIADSGNNHNNNPELTRGEVVGLEMSADGLDAVLEVTEAGEKLLKDNPKLGVSARIELNAERANDGKVFPYVLQHVLGTVNPRVVGMRPWEKVDLSIEDGSEIIDLSTEKFDTTEDNMSGKTTAPPAPKAEGKEEDKGELTPVQLSKEDFASFQEMLEDQKKAKELALASPDGEEDEPEGDEPEGDEGDDAPAPYGLTAEAAVAIELAKAQSDTSAKQVLELANQLRIAQVERELDEFRHQGLAPAVVDLARPVLEMASAEIELSNGNKVDPGEVMRKVLKEVVDLSSTGELVVDLAIENGVALAGSEPEQTARQAKLAAWDNEQY